MSGHIYSPDEEILFRATESFITKGNFIIKPIEAGFGTKRDLKGNEYPQYGIGQPVLAAPFYLLGAALGKIMGERPVDEAALQEINYARSEPEGQESSLTSGKIRPEDADFSGAYKRLGVSLFNSFIAALCGALLFLFLIDLGYSGVVPVFSALLYSLGTLAFVHQRTFFTEPLAALCVMLSFMFANKALSSFAKDKAKEYLYIVLSGFFAGYSLITRADSILLLAGIYIFIAGKFLFEDKLNKEKIFSIIKKIVAFSLPIFLFGCLFLLLNYLRYGGFFKTGYEDQPEGVKFSAPFLAGAYGFLFSAGKGMFFFSPPLLLALFGIKNFHKEHKALSTGLWASVALFFFVMAKWQNWPGGWCWGPRHIFQIHILLALFIAPALKPMAERMRRIVFIAFLLIGIYVQLLGSSVSFIDAYYEMFRTPHTPPNAYALYAEDETAVVGSAYCIYLVDENGKFINIVPPKYLPAPLNDSIYVPQNTQWNANCVLLKSGRHDFFWLKIFSGRFFI